VCTWIACSIPLISVQQQLQPSLYGTMYGIKRTTIYLPDQLKTALERTAAAEGRSEAEVVRSALAAATAAHTYPAPRLPLFESDDGTLAERVDEELARGFGA
jgi:plasmid stability protein